MWVVAQMKMTACIFRGGGGVSLRGQGIRVIAKALFARTQSVVCVSALSLLACVCAHRAWVNVCAWSPLVYQLCVCK